MADGGRVESVVVRWSQIYHHVIEIVPSFVDFVNEGLNWGVLRIIRASKEEFVQSVRSTLDAVNGGVYFINFTETQNPTVTWRGHMGFILRFCDLSDSCFKLTGEKLVKGFIEFQIWVQHLIKIYSVDFSKGSIYNRSKIVKNWSYLKHLATLRLQTLPVSLEMFLDSAIYFC